ncbi:MAG: FTR1 family protein, partial [Singulisphaera sp.]
KRWLDFLKRQARRGSEAGGHRTLALTAFLAVYREGAETALMYQALVTGHGQARAGAVGLLAGFVVGLVLLVAIALVIRATSLRLPLRAFFTLTGFVLFAMAVVFAGNGIFELQSSGILKVTAVSWLGTGVPFLGLHPNIQVLSVQALLVAGAVLALAFAGEGTPSTSKRVGAAGTSMESAPKAGVGV